MLDIKVPQIQKHLTSFQKVQKFFENDVTITEKFDGTKLTLIRNEEPLNVRDRTKNWIVAYKGNRIYAEEFEGVKNEMLKHSIGVCQYKRVFDLLRAIPEKSSDVPQGTELFIEFIQNKTTLTRDYKKFGDMFLLGYAFPVIFTSLFRVETASSELNESAIPTICREMGFKQPPVLFAGKIDVNENTLEELVEKYSNMESSLGGQAEGVVIKNAANERVKIVAKDQYDKVVRSEKKKRYALDEPEESKYWEMIREQAKNLVVARTFMNVQQHLACMSVAVYRTSILNIKAKNSKKHPVIRRDDLMLTAKMLLEEEHEMTENGGIGVIPLAGRPLHAGHWSLIENAAKESKTVYLFVSNKSRGDGSVRIEHRHMLKVWKDVLMKHLPKNVVLRFSESPLYDSQIFVRNHLTSDHRFTFYGDETDVKERWNEEKLASIFHDQASSGKVLTRGFKRSETVDVSGTQMRKWFEERNYNMFLSHLPLVLNDDERKRYMEILLDKKK